MHYRSPSSNSHKGWPYKEWQQAVFAKDGYKCVICGNTNDLTADHIFPVVSHPELKYQVSNGRTLCDKCRVEDMLKGWQKGIFRRTKQ